jgi:hypothetical protein
LLSRAEKKAADDAAAQAQADADKRAAQLDAQLAAEKAKIEADGADRIALLQGLLDTDGYCGDPTPEFSSASSASAVPPTRTH